MENHRAKTWLMVLTVVLIFVGSCHSDLKTKVHRTRKNGFCGKLNCWSAKPLADVTSISAIRVFNYTNSQDKMQLVSVEKEGPIVDIITLSSRAIEGSGRIDGFKANLSIKFRSPEDCQSGSFMCELEYVDTSGQVNSLQTPAIFSADTELAKERSSDTCDCDVINSKMSELTKQVESNTQQTSSVNEHISGLSTEFAVLYKIISALSKEIKDLSKNNTQLSIDLSELKRYEKTQSAELSALRQDILNNHINQSAELILLRQINKDLYTEVADLKKENTIISSQIRALQNTAAFNGLNPQQSASNTDDLKHYTALSAELSELRKECTLQSTELSALREELTNMSTKIANLKQNNSALSSELLDLRKENANQLQQIELLNSQIKTIQDHLSSGPPKDSTTTPTPKTTTETPTTTPETPTTTPETPTTTPARPIVKSGPGNECSRGMEHSSPRVKFLLWGQIPALCDTETDGGGWVVIQRRTKGDVDFYKDWQSYKTGFGTTDTDFWLGNDVIYNLTLRGYSELRVDMDFNTKRPYAQYDVFSVAKENQNYRLTVSGYNGTAGDSLSYHNNMEFSTYDRDNDKSSGKCAINYRGAWWYNGCYASNLNGNWGVHNASGIIWQQLNDSTPLTSTEIKVRLWEPIGTRNNVRCHTKTY